MADSGHYIAGRKKPRPHEVREHAVRPYTRRAHTVSSYRKRNGEEVHGYSVPVESVRGYEVREHRAAGNSGHTIAGRRAPVRRAPVRRTAGRTPYQRKKPEDVRLHSNPWQDFLTKESRKHPNLSRAQVAHDYAHLYEGSGARRRRR